MLGAGPRQRPTRAKRLTSAPPTGPRDDFMSAVGAPGALTHAHAAYSSSEHQTGSSELFEIASGGEEQRSGGTPPDCRPETCRPVTQAAVRRPIPVLAGEDCLITLTRPSMLLSPQPVTHLVSSLSTSCCRPAVFRELAIGPRPYARHVLFHGRLALSGEPGFVSKSCQGSPTSNYDSGALVLRRSLSAPTSAHSIWE